MCQNLQPFTCFGEVSICVKNSRVGWKNPKRTKNQKSWTFCNFISTTTSTLSLLLSRETYRNKTPTPLSLSLSLSLSHTYLYLHQFIIYSSCLTLFLAKMTIKCKEKKNKINKEIKHELIFYWHLHCISENILFIYPYATLRS